jgi:hypothetical protein
MKIILSLACVLAATFGISAQKTNDAIQKQIKSLKADRQIVLSYDKASNASKIMATSGNFADSEAKKAGIQAMNFGMAYLYTGQSLAAPPETINLTFWVLTKKPVFASVHGWTTTALNLGDARYASKPGENMEYLNFKVARADLEKIAASDGKFKVGGKDFTFTPSHLQLFKNILAVSDNR